MVRKSFTAGCVWALPADCDQPIDSADDIRSDLRVPLSRDSSAISTDVERFRSHRGLFTLGEVTTVRYDVRPLDESTWSAFADLVEANGGIFGGCWCIGFHPEAGDKNRGPTPHRDLKQARVRAGTAHAALVFAGDECLGWAQFGSCEEVSRIKSRAAYEKGRDTELPDWRIGCCFAGKGYRRRGVATAALAGAIDLIAGLGGGTVEGYPEPAGAVPSGFLYNGALSTYEQVGFERVKPIGKHRWVVARSVEPKST